MLFAHRPVLLNEVLDALQPQDGEVYVDCTLGGGGHTEAILERASCQVIGLDRDPAALEASRERLNGFGSRFQAVRTPFSSIQQVLSDLGIHQVNGVLADLGVSSPQLDTAVRGFSFSRNGPFAMRMDPDSKFAWSSH